MPEQNVTFHIKAGDPLVRSHRREIADQVLKSLQQRLPESCSCSVICLIDDLDFPELKLHQGVANRGLFSPFDAQGLWGMIPRYFWDIVTECNQSSGEFGYRFDSLIYIHGSTCDWDIGLALTLAHELCHFLQYATERSIWAANMLLSRLPESHTLGFTVWWDFPIEKEARHVAKGVAETLYGPVAVRDYILMKVNEQITNEDAKDWNFMLGLSTSTPYAAAAETKLLVRKYKPQLKQLQSEWIDHHDLSAVDLDVIETN